MAAFLSKVFPRKKDKDVSNKRNSSSSLLEGKFEAVSPTVSPSAAHFADSGQQATQQSTERGREKEKEKESAFSLFRPKSRPLSPPPDTRKTVYDAPHLTLNLPVPKEERSRALGVVFEADPNDTSFLPDNVIGERRLNPLETLLLVKACSSAIIDHAGLETLGVMHPFWYSASPDVQRKLISLFILSLAPKSPITTLSPSPTAAVSNFNSELEFTRSPHDIAAVLRWALRHLRLEGESFGRASGQWNWYQAFAEAERTSSYPPSAFSDALVPQLPPSHHQLLVATLDIVSSLASHSEHNGVSGSKLSKLFGLWLLTVARSEPGDDWPSFYARWERAGRILEHLFLAHIRDESARKKMPLRLTELVKGYPYHSRSPSTDTTPGKEDDLLPRPRFSTRQYSALYVRVDTELPDAKTTKPKPHPLRLITDALKSDLELSDAQYQSVWEALRTVALTSDEPEPILSNVDGYPSLSRVFADETTRILSFVPAERGTAPVSTVPTIRLPRPPRRRSTSLNSPTQTQPNGNGKAPATTTNGTAKEPPTSPTSPSSPKDWSDFSSAGFGESTLGKDFAKTLLDKDVEVTAPPTVERKTSKKRKPSPRRSSVDSPDPQSATRAAELSAPKPPKSKSKSVRLVKLDEAFIDFWSDALLDPISSDWPNFVIAQLKPIPGVEIDGKPIGWLVLEQTFVAPPPPPPTSEESATSPTTPRRASSPRPSIRSEFSHRKVSTLSAMKKRFTFSASSQSITTLAAKADTRTRKSSSKAPKVGEMGEILHEVEEKEEPKKEEAKKDAVKKEEAAPATPEEAKPAAPAPATEAAKAVEPDTVQEVVVPAATLAVAATAAAAAASAPSPTDALSPLTPTADDFPPVPVVGGLLPTASKEVEPSAPAAVEPIKTEDAVLEETPVVAVAEALEVPTDETSAAAPEEEKALPPAPEHVVLTGETVGPQVALSTSEPAALAEISTKVDEIVQEAASLEPEESAEVIPEPVKVEEVIPLLAAAAPEPAVEEAPAPAPSEPEPEPEQAVAETAAPAEPESESAAVEIAPAPVVEEAPTLIVEETAPEVSEPEPVAEVAAVPEPEPTAEEAVAAPEPAPAEPVVEEASTPVAEPEPAVEEPEVSAAAEPIAESAPAAETEVAPLAAESEPAPVVVAEESAPVPEPEIEATAVVEEAAAAPSEEPAALPQAEKEVEPTPAVQEPVAPAVEESAAETPAAPAIEEQVVVDEPTVLAEEPDAPVVEEPAEPVVEEPAAPVVEEPAAPVVEEAAVPAAEEVAAPEPVVEAAAPAPAVEEPVAEPEVAAEPEEPSAEESAAPTEPEPTAEEATPAEASLDPAPPVEEAAAVEKHENGAVHTEPHTEEKSAAAEETQ